MVKCLFRAASQKWALMAAVALVALLGLAVDPSMAQTSGPPEMDDIVFPVSVTSIVSVISAAGVVLMLAWFGTVAGFRLIPRLFRRILKAM